MLRISFFFSPLILYVISINQGVKFSFFNFSFPYFIFPITFSTSAIIILESIGLSGQSCLILALSRIFLLRPLSPLLYFLTYLLCFLLSLSLFYFSFLYCLYHFFIHRIDRRLHVHKHYFQFIFFLYLLVC